MLTKVRMVKALVFFSSHVRMWELDHKEGWAPKNWCFQTVVLEKTLESLWDCKEIKPVHPKGNQPWIFIGRIDFEAETPILWPPDAKSWFIWLITRSWWWTGRPGVLQSMGLQRVGHDWATEQWQYFKVIDIFILGISRFLTKNNFVMRWKSKREHTILLLLKWETEPRVVK